MLISFPRNPGMSASRVIVAGLTPEDAEHLPGAPIRVGGRHIVLLKEAAVEERELKAPMSAIQILALGDAREAIFIIDEKPAPIPVRRLVQEKGDAAFLEKVGEEIGRERQRVATALLKRIRETYEGDLTPTENPRKFIESPDNFWAVEIQVRKEMLKFIIRANESVLSKSSIAYASERPPSYFYIKVAEDRDIETALRFLALADRK